MGKSLYIAEKPSVAKEFAKVLKINTSSHRGWLESEDTIVTWCVGHLVTMSYPEAYDIKYKKWRIDTLPFLPKTFKYEVIPSAAGQYTVVSNLLNRTDVDTIYVCTDSGREGEYIYRLVDRMANVVGKSKKRVWIDSQTEDEILRGIREAKDLSAYDNLAAAAYLRAKEDYLMGINFSRILTLKYGGGIASFLKKRYAVVSVGRVMTCVLGMVVRRERDIRNFVKIPFYRVVITINAGEQPFDAEWKAVEGSQWYQSPRLYKENGFREKDDADGLAASLKNKEPRTCVIDNLSRKQEKKNPPLLFNLAELQNECSKRFKISPDTTLAIIQELYEKKLVTYPRTDARVISSAVAKVIDRNIKGLTNYQKLSQYASEILDKGSWKSLSRTRYVNDSQITDHYAIIPTGQGLSALSSLKGISASVYEIIARRFLSIFMPPAVYQRYSITARMDSECFFSNFKVLTECGYLEIAEPQKGNASAGKSDKEEAGNDGQEMSLLFLDTIKKLKKGAVLSVDDAVVKEGETSPPRRYNSGSMILAMENAGQLIEDEELREQIKSTGIGTSATRAEILKKLVTIGYLDLNKKTQIISPTQNGEMIFDTVNCSIRSLLNPELTASWEKGLNYVADGTISENEYINKLESFVQSRTDGVKTMNNERSLVGMYKASAEYYKASYTKKEKQE